MKYGLELSRGNSYVVCTKSGSWVSVCLSLLTITDTCEKFDVIVISSIVPQGVVAVLKRWQEALVAHCGFV